MSPAVEIDTVRRALKKSLPGMDAQARMMPRPRAPSQNDEPARGGGVLLLLYPVGKELSTVLTRRTEHLPNHKGQISLPGGTRHPGETFEETALREAHEELNVNPQQVDILGRLTPLYIPPSNYRIHPILGYAAARPAFQREPREVAEVLEVPLRRLLDPNTIREEDWQLRGVPVRVPFFELNEHKVWGATAMVLSEFVELLRREIA